MTDPQALGALFKQAAEIAQQVPESLREAAFQRALDALLPPQVVPPPGSRVGHTRQTGVPNVVPKERGAHSATVTMLSEVLDRTELAGLLRGRKVLDRALLLLRAAQNHDIDSMTAAEIADVLTQKFREPTKASAVRMALDRSPTYTDRRPSGGTFMYSLMAPGDHYLEGLAIDTSEGTSTVQPRKRKATPAQKPPTQTKRPKANRPAAPRAKRTSKSGRPGPKVALEELVNEGFFSQARAMGDILTHLRVDKTYSYKTSDMTATLQRLVRQGILSRSRNAEAQFQYTAK